MHKSPLGLYAPAQNLQRLLLIRALVLLGLFITCGISFWQLELSLPYTTLLCILTSLGVVNLLTFIRLKKPWPVTDSEFFSQLQLDLISIGLLLYFSGGASNPFISYLLVPICIAAATLRPLFGKLTALTAAAIYTLLLFYYLPIPALAPEHSHHSSSVNLHIIGMWLNFVVSTLLVTYFVTDMAKELRQREDLLHQHNEDKLRDEQLMAVATLAAGTAHELGTPLSTMKILLHDMHDEYHIEHIDNSALNSDLSILTQQVDHCSTILRQLVQQAESCKEVNDELQQIKSFCEKIIDRWYLLNPKVTASIKFIETNSGICAPVATTVAQSILSVLNNAADAASENIEIYIDISLQSLSWTILDRGPGIPIDMMDKLGQPFYSNKNKGFGLGLFLSQSTLNRYNGSIKLYNRKSGGTRAELKLPFDGKTL